MTKKHLPNQYLKTIKKSKEKSKNSENVIFNSY